MRSSGTATQSTFVMPQMKIDQPQTPRENTPVKIKQSNPVSQAYSPTRKIDYDNRNNNFLSSMRKMFEEFRTCCESGEIKGNSVHEINGEQLFQDNVKTFDGGVSKEDFVYTILEKDFFSLDRTEVANVSNLMLNISQRNDKGNIDLDELQYSYKSYLKYQELIEARIIDLFEKFKLSINKRLIEASEFEQLAADIENESIDSKITILSLKTILED